jgi:hypothetical protein
LLSERAAPIPEGTIPPHHHTHLGHDQEVRDSHERYGPI